MHNKSKNRDECCLNGECRNGKCCLNDKCRNGKCTKEELWNLVDESKKQWFSDNINNFILNKNLFKTQIIEEIIADCENKALQSPNQPKLIPPKLIPPKLIYQLIEYNKILKRNYKVINLINKKVHSEPKYLIPPDFDISEIYNPYTAGYKKF